MDGWIKIHRQIMEDPIYLAEPFSRGQAWIDLILLACYKDSYVYVRGIRVKVARGQLAKSSGYFAERWRWSAGKVVRFLNELENDERIVQQKSRVTTIISICNYDMYQTDGITERRTDGVTESRTDCVTESGTDSVTDGIQTDEQIGELYIIKKEINKELILSKESLLTKRKESPSVPSDSTEPEAVVGHEKTVRIPFSKIVSMWNSTCSSYPNIFTLSDSRKNKIRLRIEEMKGVENAMKILRTVFLKMQETPFLKGDNRRGWKAGFDWLFENNRNWVKVYEGKYEKLNDDEDNQRKVQSGRRGFEVTAASAEDYSGTF
ncbi:MAG: hypothetical protein ACI30I_04245 [Parabacteroides sp.]